MPDTTTKRKHTMKTQKHYYNAKPSKLSNLGEDVQGAKRMNFNTYETDAEKQARRSANRALKDVTEALKSAILSETPDFNLIIALFDKQFELKWGMSGNPQIAKPILAEKRANARSIEEIKTFNQLVRAYNKLQTDTRGLDSVSGYAEYKLKKLARRYKPKTRPMGEKCGKTFNWSDFGEVSTFATDIKFLEAASSAVQFGNSVNDKERAYIIKSLSDFLAQWKNDSIFKHIDLTPIRWSFGARGKPNSVAYFQANGLIISVNRNNIGSLIHEIGHYIDHRMSNVSRYITRDTIMSYRKVLIEAGLDGRVLAYYLKREEIFARAFEAYCLKVKAGFRDFAQVSGPFLPELNKNLLTLIDEAIRNCGIKKAA